MRKADLVVGRTYEGRRPGHHVVTRRILLCVHDDGTCEWDYVGRLPARPSSVRCMYVRSFAAWAKREVNPPDPQ